MAAVELTFTGVLYDKQARTARPVAFIGEAFLTNVGVGGGPIIPGPGEPPVIWPGPGPLPGPEHPIVIPPPPVDPPPGNAVKPPPDDGGWGYFPQYGWGYFPKAGEAGPKAKK